MNFLCRISLIAYRILFANKVNLRIFVKISIVLLSVKCERKLSKINYHVLTSKVVQSKTAVTGEYINNGI